MSTRSFRSNAIRIGSAVGTVTATVAAFGSNGPALAGDPQPQERCIDTIGDPSNAESDTWDGETWDAYFSTCVADFGLGKLIVDVVTEEGDPVPTGVDLDSIVDAFDFGYADPLRDAQKARFDPACDIDWEDFGRQDLEFFHDGINDYTDFRMDENVAGRRVRVLQLLGDVDDPLGPGMDEFDILPNELLFSWFCNGDTDELRMLGVDDVGGGYRLLPGVNASFTGFNLDGNTEIQVVVSLIPLATTTTTIVEETTTTVAETTTTSMAEATTTAAPTTTVAPTTTGAGIIPPPPATLSPILPDTGQEGGTAALAALMVALGLGTTALARRRSS